MIKVLRKLGNILYATVVLAVVLMAVLFMGTKVSFFGYEMRVVQSGSMEPAIPTGSVVVISPQSIYQENDVVTYYTGTRGSIPVTHRIVRKTQGELHTYYATKGDANEEADPRPVSEPQIMGRVQYHLPYLGYVVEFARTPLGFLLLIGIPALVIVLDEFANITWEIHKWRHLRARTRKGKVGYRTPSRERQSREFGQLNKKPARVAPPRPQQHRPQTSRSTLDLDLRHYQSKQHST